MFVSLETVNKLKYGSTIYGNEAVGENYFIRLIQAVRNLFSGGVVKHDRDQFDAFYSIYKGAITDYGKKIQAGESPALHLTLTRQLLEAEARFQMSAMGSSLKEYQPFKEFSEQVEALRKLAADNITQTWAFQSDDMRWIHSEHQQRLFAACNRGALPYKYEELPPGSVILYYPDAWQYMHLIKGKKPKGDMIWQIKALFCELFTGGTYIHAEMALNDGKTFDLDNKELRGSSHVEIKDRKGKICFFNVVAPHEKRMLAASGQTNFSDLMHNITHEGETEGSKVDSTLAELVKVGLYNPRPADYDCTKEWSPGVNRFACSGTIAALYGKFGVDIGNHIPFKKKVENISPADYTRCSLFKPFYGIRTISSAARS